MTLSLQAATGEAMWALLAPVVGACEDHSLAIERDWPSCMSDHTEVEFDATKAGEAEAGEGLPAEKGAAEGISELALVADKDGLLPELQYCRYDDDGPAAGLLRGTTVFGRTAVHAAWT